MSLSALKQKIPWPLKIALKILLARLPAGAGFWRRVDVFRHGHMDRPEYALKGFSEHLKRSGLDAAAPGFACLELGPGDSLYSALVAKSFGAVRTYLIDVGPFAEKGVARYRQMAAYLAERGLAAPDLGAAQNLDDVLEVCGAVYGARGLQSLKELPDRSVDFVWSRAVLEHVRRAEFAETMSELRRILKPGGVCSHGIDLQDHLAGALNNLRFPERIWESEFFASSGFYTNRIQYSEMLEMFREAGFSVEVTATRRWDRLPTPRTSMARPFRDLPGQELKVSSFGVLLTA